MSTARNRGERTGLSGAAFGMRPSVLCLLAVCLLVVLLPAHVRAQEAGKGAASQVVRVACDMSRFLWLDRGEPRGVCAPVLQALARHCGWRLVYVPGTWEESRQRLLNDEIDLIFPMRKTPRKEQEMGFSALCGGYQSIALYASRSSGILFEDFASFDGKRIAMNADSRNAALFRQYAAKHGFSFIPVDIESAEERLAALRLGKADMCLYSTLSTAEDDVSVVAFIGAEPFYYAVSPHNRALLNEIDEAMLRMLVERPAPSLDIAGGAGVRGHVAYSPEENAVAGSGREITVGLYEDTAPLAYVDRDGKPAGIYNDVLRSIASRSGLTIRVHPIPRSQYAYDLLRDGVVDFIIGVNELQFTAVNDGQFVASRPVLEYKTTGVIRKSYQFAESVGPGSVALTLGRSYWRKFIAAHYENAHIRHYATAKQCLEAVARGEADVTLLSSIEFSYQTKNSRFDNLAVWEPLNKNSSALMVALSTVDPALLGVLNKAISDIPDKEIEQILYTYFNMPYQYSFSDWLYKVRYELMAAGIVMFCTIVFLCIYMASRRRHLAMLEKKNAALEKACAAKTDFLARVSHDMRTPMNGILCLAALMKDKTDLAEIRRDLAQMSLSGEYLLNLINDTLDMSKIESGRMVLRPAPVDRKVLLENVLVHAMRAAEEKGVRLETRLPRFPGEAWIMADSSRLEQLIMNLVSNAVKYTPSGGRVDIVMESSVDGDMVTDSYVISDTGIGISEEFLPHIFEPFSQERLPNAERQEGAGLGMAIVKDLVDLMGGEIAIESRLGQGTKISLRLRFPRCAPPHGEGEAGRNHPATLQGRHVLLCEDHPLNASIMTQLLGKWGVSVDCAENGRIGVERFRKAAPGGYDAVLMDLRMPVMDGLEASRAIRELEKGSGHAVPIIALTANAFDDDVRQCLEAGINEHVSKPVNVEKLRQILEHWIA